MVSVSIIIPIHNNSNYLRRCLDSVTNQTIDSFDVFMVDDGSIDNSAEICEEYLSDKRFHYIYQENQGVSVARNTGIKSAEGEWLVFLDSDDFIEPEFLEKLLLKAEKENAEIVCCCAKYEINGTIQQISFYKDDCIFSENEPNTVNKKELYLQLMDNSYKTSAVSVTAIGVPWGKIYKKDLILRKEIEFDPKLKRLQDNIFNMYAFDAANKVVYINEPLYNYTLDHIHNFRWKYHSTAPINYELVSQYRKAFLQSKGLFYDPDINSFYYQEVIRMTDQMLFSYYLNDKNPKNKSEIIRELKDEFEKPMFIEAFDKGLSKVQSIRSRIYIYLLQKKHYSLLFIIHHLFVKFKKK